MLEFDSAFGNITSRQQQPQASWTSLLLRNRWVDVPPEILHRMSWSSWRRVLNRPDLPVLAQIEAWRQLAQTSRDTKASPPEPLCIPRRPGIFGPSRVYWENLSLCARDSTLNGWARGSQRAKQICVTNPQGHLALSATFDDFLCDITDIDGISASKSMARMFESVDAFGRDYCEYRKTPVSAEGMNEMLRHREVRILRSPSSDTFGLDMWDGRLFLNNHGGSHHFAGAAYIARAIRRPLSLSGRLQVRWLNEPAWQWLLDRYRVLHVGTRHRVSLSQVAMIAQECLELELPGNVGQGKFVFIPRKASALDALLRLLTCMRAVEVTGELTRLLTHQSQVMQRVTQRWAGQVRLPQEALGA